MESSVAPTLTLQSSFAVSIGTTELLGLALIGRQRIDGVRAGSATLLPGY